MQAASSLYDKFLLFTNLRMSMNLTAMIENNTIKIMNRAFILVEKVLILGYFDGKFISMRKVK
jgi:hypothetical protein